MTPGKVTLLYHPSATEELLAPCNLTLHNPSVVMKRKAIKLKLLSTSQTLKYHFIEFGTDLEYLIFVTWVLGPCRSF